MKNIISKKILPLLLVTMMLFSMTPVQVFAEIDHSDHNHNNENVVESDKNDQSSETIKEWESTKLNEAKAKIDAYLTKYLGMTTMSMPEVEEIVWEMDEDTMIAAWDELELLKKYFDTLTDAEIYFLEKYENVETFGYLWEVLDQIFNSDISLFTTHSVVSGSVSISDSANSSSLSGGTVTITAKGSLISKKTNNITITNDSGNKAQLSFSYTVDKANSFKIAGADAAASGSYSVILAPGASLSITLVSNNGFSNTTATLKISNISLTAIAENSNVTFAFDSTLGSVTAGGNAVVNGDVLSVSGTDGVELVATAKSGSQFLGWTDADGMILSTATTYKLVPAQNMTVKAAFATNGGTPWFGVGSASSKTQSTGLLGLSKLTYYQVGTSYLFDDLNAAATYAAANSTKVLVLMNNATLPVGDYTIPVGVTLLIPFDNANTMYSMISWICSTVISGHSISCAQREG